MTQKRSPVPQMRGVQAFLSTSSDRANSRQTVIPVDKIRLSLKQPRRYFDQAKMEQLIQSIKEHGILEPLLVRPLDGSYELVAGERRYRAAQSLGLDEVPITLRDLSDREALQVALVENLQREDLNPVEETEGILELLALELDSSKEGVIALLNRAANARKRGQELTENASRQLEQVKSLFEIIGRITPESFRTARLPLLNLPSGILDALRQGKLAYTKAHVIARVKDEVQRQTLLEEAIEQELSLNQVRERIKDLSPEQDTTSPKIKVESLSRQVIKAKLWENPKKWKQALILLAKLQALATEE